MSPAPRQVVTQLRIQLTHLTRGTRSGCSKNLFEYADQLAGGQTSPQSADTVIHDSLADMGAHRAGRKIRPSSPRLSRAA